MNVRTLCLSILFEGEATGYEIRRLCVEGECSYFIEASFGSIYPALARLEENGFVVSRTEQQDGKPAKKIYSITEAGRAEFTQQLAEPLGEDMFRSPFLLFARFAHILPRELVEARVNEYLKRTIEDRKKLVQVETARSCNAADTWVMNYGRAMMEVAERHLRTHMHELITMARAEPDKDAAE
ncbi:PadR family transcriptional regulator [Devosia neptuniae]|jgi:PadR family transcriptional regulator AphA|uniref:PadR family transcriptional regulator n=1 Tax=Devosia TaxID=46913 RepID=UPI0022AE8ED6|nr:PadR family transcriptional regulator [Devosia neptuniae]MCZ4344951.1 PadR family transcriptional regulator [Devosia neptuniae]|tara:strand:- start:9072 stop:9620 length:549 start_codon:yes stop_codon:yes gene_type:complete